MSFAIAFLALIYEFLYDWTHRNRTHTGNFHPVVWMGWLISKGEARFNDPRQSFEARRLYGVGVLACVLLIVFALSYGLHRALATVPPIQWVIEAILACWLLAGRQLREAVARVSRPLHSGNLAAAREALWYIVGRDTKTLEKDEIARAAIETLAENASDGFVAPLFWLLVLGFPGLVIYKAINTADSMIGHKNERYLAFGWAAARLDDVANFIPARLTALGFMLAAVFMRGADPAKAWHTVWRDAPKHASPNAGWPEAAMAGALGLRLGGPRAYQGIVFALPQMGEGRRDLNAGHVRRALKLYDGMCWLCFAAVGAGLVVWLLITVPALRP